MGEDQKIKKALGREDIGMEAKRQAEIKKELIASLFHKNRLLIMVEVITSIFLAIMAVSVSWVTQELMDVTALAPGAKPLSQMVAITGTLLLIFVGFQLVDYHAKPKFVKRAMRQYKELAFEKLTEKNISSFRMENTATYLSAFSNDAASVESGYLCGFMDIINQVVNLIGAFALMLWYSPLMALIAALITLFPLVVSICMGNRLAPAERKVSEQNVEYTATLSDCLNGFAVVKSFLAEKEVRNLFGKKNQELEQVKYKRMRIGSLVGVIGLISGFVAQIGVFVAGAFLAVNGHPITAGVVLAFVNLMNNVLGPIGRLPGLFAQRKAALGLIDKLAGALAANSQTEGKEEVKSLTNGIRLENVSFGYEEEKEILKGVDTFFEAGKSYAIVGESGSGKSTLLNLLMAGNMGYQGKIQFDNTDLKNANVDSLYEMLSIIQQNVFVFDASIKDNVTMFRDFAKEDLEDALNKAHLSELIKKHGDEYRCGENGKGLSGGEKQRISIARSLLRKSSVLLVDEATAALDRDTAFHVSQDILDLKDVTRIVVTHALDEALLKQYDGILVLRNGHIEESGTFDHLMEKNGYFHALYTIAQ